MKFKPNNDSSSEDLSFLKVLDRVFKETNRTTNSTPMLTDRTVTRNSELCGYKINKGDKIKHIHINFQPEYSKDPD